MLQQQHSSVQEQHVCKIDAKRERQVVQVQGEVAISGGLCGGLGKGGFLQAYSICCIRNGYAWHLQPIMACTHVSAPSSSLLWPPCEQLVLVCKLLLVLLAIAPDPAACCCCCHRLCARCRVGRDAAAAAACCTTGPHTECTIWRSILCLWVRRVSGLLLGVLLLVRTARGCWTRGVCPNVEMNL